METIWKIDKFVWTGVKFIKIKQEFLFEKKNDFVWKSERLFKSPTIFQV